MTAANALLTRGAESSYQVVANWARFPEGVTAWSAASGVDLGPDGNMTTSFADEHGSTGVAKVHPRAPHSDMD
jgi:hypothetical protein